MGSERYRAEQHDSGWWVVVDADGRAIDDSADGGFFEFNARVIATALNAQPTDLISGWDEASSAKRGDR